MLLIDHLDEGTQTRLLRVAARLTQHELAARAGLDRRRLSEHERGERPLRDEELAHVRAVLKQATPQLQGGVASAVA